MYKQIIVLTVLAAVAYANLAGWTDCGKYKHFLIVKTSRILSFYFKKALTTPPFMPLESENVSKHPARL